MTNYTISIDKSEDIKLFNFELNRFKLNNSETNKITIIGKTFDEIKNLFYQFNTIEVFCDSNLVLETSNYNGLATIKYIGQINVTVEDSGETELEDLIEVELTRVSLFDKIRELDEIVNPVTDIENMSVPEYMNYVLSNISEECNADICEGDDITISTGTKRFTFKTEDQGNLSNAFSIITQSNGAITHFPYHASGEGCALFTAFDIINIYLTLQLRLTKLTTYCNQLNMYVRTLTDKETLSMIKYGMDLPEEYQAQMDALMEVSTNITNALRAKYLGPLVEDTSEEETK